MVLLANAFLLFGITTAVVTQSLSQVIDHPMICRSAPTDSENGRSGSLFRQRSPDYRDVENMIEQRVTKGDELLKNKIEILERRIQDLSSMVTQLEGARNHCEEGFLYEEKCYYAIIHKTSDVQWRHRNATCATNGGSSAAILNKVHQALAENYLRLKIPDSETEIWIYVGMSYDHSTETIKTDEGTSFPASLVNWIAGYPTEGSQILIEAPKTFGSQNQGLFISNMSDDATARGIFCRK